MVARPSAREKNQFRLDLPELDQGLLLRDPAAMLVASQVDDGRQLRAVPDQARQRAGMLTPA